MNSKELVSKVWKKAEELCEDTGLSVWDVTFEKEGKNYYLTVFIDREEGVYIEDCEKISRALDPYLEQREFSSLPPYTLSVSSPGLERRIVRPEHFEWAVGKQVDLTFYKAREGVSGICGVLEKKEDDRLYITQNENLLELDMADIASVRLHFEI